MSYEEPTDSERTRFESKVLEVPGPLGHACWEWQGQVQGPRVGYGVFWWRGMNHKAHRVSYLWYTQRDIPEDMFVCHHCDNGRCVYPGHLYLGDYVTNAADKTARGRNGGAHKGIEHHNARLTDDDVRAIRAVTGTGNEIAERFGITRHYVYLIRRRARRADVV